TSYHIITIPEKAYYMVCIAIYYFIAILFATLNAIFLWAFGRANTSSAVSCGKFKPHQHALPYSLATPTHLGRGHPGLGSITLKGPLGKLTPRQIEVLGNNPSFDFTTKMSMDFDPKGSLAQGVSVWYIDVLKFEHGGKHQGYGYPMWPGGQPASVVKLLLEATDCEEPPRLFRRIGIVHMQSGEQDAMVCEATIV
ncbi:hypothetical protein FLAG1_11965, partial [Fusarium langsethiae]